MPEPEPCIRCGEPHVGLGYVCDVCDGAEAMKNPWDDKPAGNVDGTDIPVFGIEGLEPERSRRVAKLGEWITACAEAHLRLCVGEGAAVHKDSETWEQAIVRVAARLIVTHGLGRPRGKLPAKWVQVVHHVAGRPSSAPDGLVAAGSLRVPLSALFRTRKSQ